MTTPASEIAAPPTATAKQSTQAPPASDAGTDVTRAAGRGGLAVAFAKVYFILVGLVQQIALPRLLGLDGYGALASVLSIAGITYNPVTTTSIQSVSRAVAQSTAETQAGTIQRVFKVHAVFALLLAGGFFLLAPTIAESVGAGHVVGPLRILSCVMLIYGLYTPLIGVLNGQRRFVAQATLDVVAGTLRTAGLIAGAFVLARYHLAVEGATLGFVAGASLILVVALSLVGIGKRGAAAVSVREHIVFALPVLLGQVLFNLLLQADLTLLRRFASEAALAKGLTSAAADPLVGAYRATQLFSFLPYQLLIAITFILFPMLASAARDGDRAAVARYVRTGVRLALVLAGLMVSVTAGLSDRLLFLVFGAEAARLGGSSLELLALGFGGFAIFGVLTTVLNSLKHERQTLIVTAVAVSLVVALCYLRVRGAPFGEPLLLYTAQATAAGLVVATLSAAFFVYRAAGAVAPPLTLLRVLLGVGAAVALGRVLPHAGKIVTPVYAALVALVYLLILVMTRELAAADLTTLRAVATKRRSS
ncbi:MAG TPA: lipopolysaccharide biosynthesis protein [Polyangiaceae bacterium]|nr:lipopolysaccharide biosynthesis protein [Polyangiaceae bacterium]